MVMIMDDEYGDIEDIECPKCGSPDYDWENIDSYPNGNIWMCTCADCGKKFRVMEQSFYRIMGQDEW